MRSNERRAIWVWHSDAPHGGFLFYGNPNAAKGLPPYHLGGVMRLINGDEIVYAYTCKALEMTLDVAAWNMAFPQFKVKPMSIMVEMRPYYIRKRRGAVNGNG